MDNGCPAEGWKIWIGWYQGLEWNQRYRHHGHFGLYQQTSSDLAAECKTQFSTFVFGELLIHAVSSTLPELNVNFPSMIDCKLKRIWPPQDETIDWPPCVPLCDIEANLIADAFFLSMLSKI